MKPSKYLRDQMWKGHMREVFRILSWKYDKYAKCECIWKTKPIGYIIAEDEHPPFKILEGRPSAILTSMSTDPMMKLNNLEEF